MLQGAEERAQRKETEEQGHNPAPAPCGKNQPLLTGSPTESESGPKVAEIPDLQEPSPASE